jgi:hypothetical protein
MGILNGDEFAGKYSRKKLQEKGCTLHAESKYRIQLKAESLKPKANTKYSYKLQAVSYKQIQNTAESQKPLHAASAKGGHALQATRKNSRKAKAESKYKIQMKAKSRCIRADTPCTLHAITVERRKQKGESRKQIQVMTPFLVTWLTR